MISPLALQLVKNFLAHLQLFILTLSFVGWCAGDCYCSRTQHRKCEKKCFVFHRLFPCLSNLR